MKLSSHSLSLMHETEQHRLKDVGCGGDKGCETAEEAGFYR